jgi:hypothetical protein
MQEEAKNEALKLIARALFELENCDTEPLLDEDIESIKNAIQLLKDTIEKLAV